MRSLHSDEGNRIVISGIKVIVIVIIIKGHGKILLMIGVTISNQISRSLALLATRTDRGFDLHLMLGAERIVENTLVSRSFHGTALFHDT